MKIKGLRNFFAGLLLLALLGCVQTGDDRQVDPQPLPAKQLTAQQGGDDPAPMKESATVIPLSRTPEGERIEIHDILPPTGADPGFEEGEPSLLQGQELTELVQLAKGDLAKRLDISIADVAVSGVLGQEFSADAFYCRKTKEKITRDESPAVISGHSILLAAKGHRYEYHAGNQGVFFCRRLD